MTCDERTHHFACDCREQFYAGVVNQLQKKLQDYEWALEAIASGMKPSIPGMASEYEKMTAAAMRDRALVALAREKK